MPREVEGQDGVRWTCTEAYAGLGEELGDKSAARVEGTDRYRVICTPSGGSKSVEVELAEGWEERLDDDTILSEIRKRRS